MKRVLALILVVCMLVSGCANLDLAKEADDTNVKLEVVEMKKVVMIVAPENFKDEELYEPKKVLEDAGVEVTIASTHLGVAKSANGRDLPVDIEHNKLRVNDYDAIVFVGGGGAEVYFDEIAAHDIARLSVSKDKVLAAICIAPSTLANAGVLEGKNATCFSSQETNLKEMGAVVVEEDVVVDGKIITANGPGAATEFGEKILEAIQ